MMKTFARCAAMALMLCAMPLMTRGQTTRPTTGPTRLNGPDLALKSSGQAVGDGWRFDDNGFAGTYVRLLQPGPVTITVDAAATLAGGPAPRVNIVVADESVGTDVTASGTTFRHTFELPVGTHFVRIEYPNDQNSGERALTLSGVTIDGAEVWNEHTDANALAAANTYINAYRRGPATLRLPGLNEGELVRIKLKRHRFNFGVVASGTEQNRYFFDDPEPGSDAWRVQRFMTENFNAVVPGNAGKWAHNEGERGKITMDLVDAITRFGLKNNMRVRMHGLLWDTNQQPRWASELLGKALAGDEQAKAELRKAVDQRMEYFLVDRAKNYFEIDGLNEQFHRPRWWQAYGVEGIADIYNDAADAVKRGGGTAPIFVNEYNVLQWSEHPLKRTGGGSDPYANWYRQSVDDLREAGGTVGGIGVQYYVLNSVGTRQGNPHSPARIIGVFQNLSVTGLPLSLSEFGVQRDGATTYDAARFLDDAARMTFGTPNMNTFMVWGFWQKEMWSAADRGAMVDENWEILPPGRTWKGLMAEWDTDVTTFAGPDGTVTFTGFYGDYEVTAGDKTRSFELVKGKTEYTVTQ